MDYRNLNIYVYYIVTLWSSLEIAKKDINFSYEFLLWLLYVDFPCASFLFNQRKFDIVYNKLQ